MEFGNDRVIHIRGSGNAPELRCYAEAESQIVAERLANEALRVVSERF
jgi:phosphomannomutase